MEDKVQSLFFEALGKRNIDSIERIQQGFSNKTFKIKSGNDFYKVRIGDHNDLISRKNEYVILKAIGDENCILYKLENGDSVWKWIEGTSSRKESIDRQYLDCLCAIVRNIHLTPLCLCESVLNHDDFEFLEITKHRFKEYDLELYKKLVNEYSEDIRVLCHNDISLGNLIYEKESKKLYLIDYEWGRINNPYWDYGNFIKESDLSSEYIEYLSEIANLDIDKLFKYCFISTLYSLQLSYIFPQQDSLETYRDRLNIQLDKYRKWIIG